MRLLLTRSAADAARTRENLQAMGHHVAVSPVLDVVGTGAQWPAGVVDAVVATSAQAFRLDTIGPSAEARRLLPLLVVGNRTLGAARTVGFVGPSLVAGTAGALARAVRASALRPHRTVYLAGRERKSDLEAALAEMQLHVDVVEIYDAQAVTSLKPQVVDAFRQDAFAGILHFSRRSAAIFLSLARQAGIDVCRPAHFCLSEDVATPLREAACPTIRVARAPNEAELLALVGASKLERG